MPGIISPTGTYSRSRRFMSTAAALSWSSGSLPCIWWQVRQESAPSVKQADSSRPLYSRPVTRTVPSLQKYWA